MKLPQPSPDEFLYVVYSIKNILVSRTPTLIDGNGRKQKIEMKSQTGSLLCGILGSFSCFLRNWSGGLV